ncbi:ABC transporter substrate-binding protein [Stappia sp.]|uniref:heme/hemin ABC transporter substrate-binding protein n=1 Tax=Stappia sp. TaxID=1870903 RepID=UPI0025E5CDCA|nr:ABC transporter substrate-binding protein [Stappia sp.]
MRFFSSTRALAPLAGAALTFLAAAHPAVADGDLSGAQRIVSIGGDVTEIVYDLGEQDRLVARDTTSSFPEAATDLPDVGYMRALAPEGVLSVKPDGILTIEGSGPPQALDVLARAGVPVATIPNGFTRDAVVAKIEAVGKALGVPEKAAPLAEKAGKSLDDAIAEARAIDRDTRVLFILSMQGGRIMGAGSDTAAAGILELAGLTNAITGMTGYKQLSDEAVIAAAPDVVLMIDRGAGHVVDPEELFSNAALSQTPAGREHRLVRMDGLFLLGFGPRTAEAVRDLSSRLAADGL